MLETRIQVLRQAVRRMSDGELDLDVPTDGDDAVAALAREIEALRDRFVHESATNRVLVEITAQLNAGLTFDEVMDHAYEALAAVIPFDRIGVALLEDDGRVLRTRWVRSGASEVALGHGYHAPIAGSSLENVLATGVPRILNDLEAYLADHPRSASTRAVVREGMRSSLTCPLLARGQPVGFLFFSSMQAQTYRDAHVELFQRIAGQVSGALDRARLFEAVKQADDQKNRFLGVVAHDLRSPAGVVKGYLDLLLSGLLGPLTERQQEVVAAMLRRTRSMLAMASDLLDVASIEAGHLDMEVTPTDLGELIAARAEGDALLASSRALEVQTRVPPDLPPVLADPRRVEQILDNLVGNAMRYSRSHTAITVGAAVDGDHVRVWVADEGPGIPADEVPRLFAAFERRKIEETGHVKGSGLGLAIVKRLVEAQQGRIWVVTAPGEGATFHFTLPRASVAR